MSKLTGAFFRATAAVLLVLLAASSMHAGSLEGRWRLDEEHYGNGKSNLAAQKPPVYLEIGLRAGAPAVSIRMGEDPDRAVAWPAYITDEKTLSVELLERAHDAARGELRARYRVHSAPGDDLVLEIVEHYRLDEERDTLTGSATVRFLRGEEARGSFVLHRRFVRAR